MIGTEYLWLFSAIVFLPALGALALAFVPSAKTEVLRLVTLAVTAVVLALTLYAYFAPGSPGEFNTSLGTMQSVFSVPWIPSFDIHYQMGSDGISMPLVVLTAFVSLLAMAASWSINKYVKAYCVLFLLLETGMLGVFLSLDFFLFYVFWEVMLLPMYFLIGVWGGERREYAAIKFFLYTLVGSVLMLIAILMIYFNSDLKALARVSDLAGGQGAAVVWKELGVSPRLTEQITNVLAAEGGQTMEGGPAVERTSFHTFNLLALMAMARHTDVFSPDLQWWCFLLLFIGFAIKVPSVPVHTWLPDAHVEAPTPISMILAGVLLKMGGYGIVRICYPICPHGGYDLAYFVCLLGVVSMVYGAFAALAQTDFKRLVAYSSVSHMGYVVLGLGVWSAVGGTGYESYYWNMGVKGAMFQMIAHGVSSPGMFFLVGVLYDRVHHRNLNKFGGVFGVMPVYTTLAMGIFFAGLGLPGLCGFIGEVLVVLSAWKYDMVLAVVSAGVVVLTAGYILWAIQRVYLGSHYKGDHGHEELTPLTPREFAIGAPMFVLAIVLGVFPYHTLLRYMDPTIDRQVRQLTTWTRDVRERGEPVSDARAQADPAAQQPAAPSPP